MKLYCENGFTMRRFCLKLKHEIALCLIVFKTLAENKSSYWEIALTKTSIFTLYNSLVFFILWIFYESNVKIPFNSSVVLKKYEHSVLLLLKAMSFFYIF